MSRKRPTPHFGYVRTFVGMRDMGEPQGTIEQACNILDTFPQANLIPFIASLNNAILTKDEPNIPAQFKLARSLFRPERLRQLAEAVASSDPPAVPFHRAQQLCLLRIALSRTERNGAAWTEDVIATFGDACLIASDLVAGAQVVPKTTERHDLLRQAIAGLMPQAQLNIDTDAMAHVGRSKALWLDIYGLEAAKGSKGRKGFVDIDSAFQQLTELA